MTLPVLVTGGTGRLGRLVVRRLRDAGRDVRVLARHDREIPPGVEFFAADLGTGEGVDPAVTGVSAVIHCASSTKGDAEATRHLLAAASAMGTPHIVYVSVVGIDHIATWSYPKAKLQAEHMVSGSGLPWTILRATQFYDYILGGTRKLARLPVLPVPAGFRVQPVHPDEVAARLVELAANEPAGRAPDMAGPQATTWVELVHDYLRLSRRRRWVLPVTIPGTRAVRDGGLLPAPGHTVGHVTWEEFLVETLRHEAAGTAQAR